MLSMRFYCEMTKEHVPPKFLSPKSPNSEFAFVSVCKKDNNINSHQESMFRDFVVTAAYSPDNKDTLAAYDAMMRNFTRNPTAQAILGKPNKDLLRVFSGMRKEALRTPAGIYLGTGVKISPAKDLDWKLILTKSQRAYTFYIPEKLYLLIIVLAHDS